MKLSLPSLDQVGADLFRIYKRFPVVIFVSVIGSVSAIWLAELSYAEQDNHPGILALAFCSGLGISFLFGLATFLEQKNWSAIAKYGIQFSGLLLMALYWILLGDKMMEGPSEVWYRFFLFALASHLFVAFAPFLNSGNVDQFWEYNKTLFLRILLSALYSGVLFVGLSVALLALDNLLDLDVDGETYFQLFLFLGGIFNTWFFLTGVPEKDAIQEKETTYPKGLRVFVQYVLIPLVTVYIVILYLYLGKIILQWELPNGWVSNLVLTFSIAGILSLLLLYPIRNSKEYEWIHIYSKGYYLALIPLIGLLMFSIWVRISEYGATINRYFVATLGVWLTGIVIYFIISKTKSIKVIPVSLCLIALGVSFGPMGAFTVSERSQLGRFEEMLSRNNLLNQEFRFQKSETEVSFEDRKELSSIVSYITESHGASLFESYFEDFSDSVDNPQEVFDLMGLTYVVRWANIDHEMNTYYFSSKNTWAGDISGFDVYLNNIILNPSTNTQTEIESGEKTWIISMDKEKNRYTVREESSQKEINIDVTPIIIKLQQKSINFEDNYSIPISELAFDFENVDLMTRLYVNTISGSFNFDTTVSNITTDILIKIK
ncbi:MAG: DUF4153 domain-containing protein [Balneolaceae bacterium]|nr:DUF4153 domain-containing protein [Balneolaceae bacterium]MBO6545885.1 DUF4153 domain-containing protein [Balneolaceae bacterium]MBO6647281.1 DUF4153 domain-containing protein [Balneolaceae bacterium]